MAPRIRRRHYRGAATAAVTALALAALTASQAPGEARPTADRAASSEESTPIDGGGSQYHGELPPPRGTAGPATPDPAVTTAPATPGSDGIPATVLAAYRRAQTRLAASQPGCHLPWQLLAAIGKVESGHASGGRVDSAGTTLSPILGPVLDGDGFARITDTDGGRLDGDTVHDRAVGPMQFIPSTWARWGADGNGDGRRDPSNVYDASLAAGSYLCANDRDLAVAADRDAAVLGYNHSDAYLRTVLAWYGYYRNGSREVPDAGGSPSGAGSSHGSPTPSAPASPSPSGSAPSEPGPAKPHDPGKPDPGKPDPSDPSDPSGPAALERLGDARGEAVAGTRFAQSARVRVTDSAGKAVAGVTVRFTISGATGSTFPGGADHAAVATGADGTATAPALTAGKKPGTFTVRAELSGDAAGSVEAVTFTRTVTAVPAPKADALARTTDDELTATTDSTFADDVQVRATYQGKAVADLPVTATMIDPDSTADGKEPEENDEGPFFLPEDGDGKPVRTLAGLKTGEDGTLTLPAIHTDGKTGTFKLRLTTADGVALVIDLKVTAADPDGTATAPASPSPSGSASPAATATGARKE
ncbi:lytic murein transglycosylase [Streptomyces sp. NPDC059740]|uniref:lytic transglycosylase domain-containing protein n=1 Tax=Streptomyces sp. NPDC059740 TaxID=3346926 RepID=UPI00364ABAAF